MKSIPVVHVSGRSIAQAYERALVALAENGVHMRTQYDRPGDRSRSTRPWTSPSRSRGRIP